MNLNEAAAITLGNLNHDGKIPAEISPAFILIIIQILQELIPMLLENCSKTPEEVLNDADEVMQGTFKGRVLRWRLLLNVRNILRGLNIKETKVSASDISSALLKTCVGINATHVDQLYQEICA